MKIQEWKYAIKRPHLYAWDLKYFNKAKRQNIKLLVGCSWKYDPLTTKLILMTIDTELRRFTQPPVPEVKTNKQTNKKK